MRVFAVALLGVACYAQELVPLEAGSSGQLTLLGNEALVQGRYETAVDMFQRAITADKNNFHAVFNLALTYQQQSKLTEAKRWYDESLRLKAGHPDALNNLGIIAFRQEEWDTAVARFQEAARASRETPVFAADSWFNAGTVHERRQAWDEARRAYEESIAADSKHVGAHFNLGTLHLGALADRPGSLERARVHLLRAVELQPTRSDAWINLGVCEERRAKARIAKPAPDPDTAFAKAVETASGRMRLDALWARARYLSRSTPPQRTAMRDDLRRILAEDPDYPNANGLLGAYHFSIGEFAKASELLEREVAGEHDDARSPGDLEAHYLLALIYTDHRLDAAKALAHATAYYRRDPDNPRILDLRRRALRLDVGEMGASKESAPETPPAQGAPAHDATHAPAKHESAKPAPAKKEPATSEHKPADAHHGGGH